MTGRPQDRVNRRALEHNTNLYDNADRQIGTLNARGYLNTTVYDQNTRAIASVNAVNAITTNIWDNAGRQIAMQDALGFLHTTVYDHNPDQSHPSTRLIISTTNVYDAARRQIAKVDANGYATTTVWDRDTRSRFLSVATVKSRMQPGILLPVSYPISCVGSDPEVWKQSGQCSLIRKDGRQPVRRGGRQPASGRSGARIGSHGQHK